MDVFTRMQQDRPPTSQSGLSADSDDDVLELTFVEFAELLVAVAVAGMSRSWQVSLLSMGELTRSRIPLQAASLP